MKAIDYFYKSPLTWLLVLSLLQIWVAVVMSPSAEKLNREKAEYEEVLLLVHDKPELADYVSTQHEMLEYKNEVLVALTDLQKYLGGLSAIILLLLLVLAYRKLRVKQQ
ncbi:hypothetical protein [Glaciecola sp. MF2-115]|uniref:hypothetical protein n=1 Tax=Glaciecola sp. MF2-115 TaxID=3384827 RepID=UPI00399F7531